MKTHQRKVGEMLDKNVKKGRFISAASAQLQRILMTRWRNNEQEHRDVLKVKPVEKIQGGYNHKGYGIFAGNYWETNGLSTCLIIIMYNKIIIRSYVTFAM